MEQSSGGSNPLFRTNRPILRGLIDIMRNTLWALACATVVLTLAVGTQAQSAAAKVCTVKVTGMTCASCAPAVKAAAKTVVGVADATVNYHKATADVTYDPAKTNPKAIADAITRQSGFKASPGESPAKK